MAKTTTTSDTHTDAEALIGAGLEAALEALRAALRKAGAPLNALRLSCNRLTNG